MLVRESADPITPQAGPGRMRRQGRAALARLTPGDRRVLGMWAGAHAALAIIAWLAGWISGNRGIYQNLLGTYGQWDAAWYQTIAAHGYFGGRSGAPAVFAFLPGMGVADAAAHLLVWNWPVAELLVSLIAGAVVMVCIRRLGGERAALYLITAPAAMYLMVGYSEVLFLALALPAWMAARSRDWLAAATLGALAGLVRVDGIFLTAALLTAAVTSPRSRRLRALGWAAFTALGPALYETYLWAGTRSATAYLQGNRVWGLRTVWPWAALHNTWRMAFGPGLPPDRAAMFQVEIACLFVGLALTLVLLWRRAWPEAVYCGLAVAVLGTTSYYQSTPRALLIMWPLYVLVAKATERRPWIGQVYLWTCAPLAVLVAVYFFLGRWAV